MASMVHCIGRMYFFRGTGVSGRCTSGRGPVHSLGTGGVEPVCGTHLLHHHCCIWLCAVHPPLVATVAPCPTHGRGWVSFLSGPSHSAAVPSPLKALPLPVSTLASMALVLARQFCQLQSSRAVSHPQGSLPPSVLGQGISTPLQAEAWE